MIALIVSLDVIPERLDEFIDAIGTNAERSFSDEPGCLGFEVTQGVADPHRFVFYEKYVDEDAVAAHRSAAHYADWRRAADRCIVPGSQVNTLATVRFCHD